jgi:hypothetical protein
MAANNNPIFVGTPKNWFVPTGLTANTALDGTGTTATLLTAGSNGSRVTKLRLYHLGTNIATVVRFFINNGSSSAVSTNNMLVHEETMAANTLSQTAASVAVEVNVDIPMAAGYKILVSIGTTIASGIAVSADGGDF